MIGACQTACANVMCSQYGCIKLRDTHPPTSQRWTQGWLCPRCGTALSPFVRQCDCKTVHVAGNSYTVVAP